MKCAYPVNLASFPSVLMIVSNFHRVTCRGFTRHRYITEEGYFTLNGEPGQLDVLDKYGVVKLPINEVKLAYKTWHPARMNKELREQVYGVILADIKENIDKLLKKG